MGAVVIDVNDLERVSAFWGDLLGGEPSEPRSGGDWVTVGSLGHLWLVLQRVPEFKMAKNRVHMDFLVDEVDRAIAHIVGLGGSKVSGRGVGGAVTMADPEGNEFSIGAFRRTKQNKRYRYREPRPAIATARKRGGRIGRGEP